MDFQRQSLSLASKKSRMFLSLTPVYQWSLGVGVRFSVKTQNSTIIVILALTHRYVFLEAMKGRPFPQNCQLWTGTQLIIFSPSLVLMAGVDGQPP